MPESADFAAFVESCSDGLLRSAWVLTGGDWPLAEDLVQTTLAVTWTHWNRVARLDKPRAYAQKILVNTYLRWSRRRWTGEVASAYLPEPAVVPAEFDQVDIRQSLKCALEELTPKQRAILMLRYFDDCSEAQVARVLGCSVGTVKSQTAKSLLKLRGIPALANILTGGATAP